MVHVQELLYDDKLLISFRTLFAQVEIPYNRLQRWLEDWPDASQVETNQSLNCSFSGKMTAVIVVC